MNVVDSSGWIEFFKVGPNGLIFKPVIEDHARLLVPTISLYEVHRVLIRALPAQIVQTCLDAMRRGRVLDLTDRRAIAASETATRHRLALVDAAIYPKSGNYPGAGKASGGLNGPIVGAILSLT